MRMTVLMALIMTTLLAGGLTSSGVAQGPRLEASRFSSTFQAHPGGEALTGRAAVPVVTTVQRSHWLEGGVVGALIGGVLGALLAADLSEADGAGTYIVGFALGGAAGFVPGALIGGLIPKS